MKNSLIAGVVVLVALALPAAQSSEPKKTDATEAMTKALEALAKAQERQAVAWEKLAEKGWPAPTNYTLTGDVPRNLSVFLTGSIGVGQEGAAWGIQTR